MKTLITIILIAATLPSWSQNPDPKEIVRKSDELLRGRSNYAEIKMTIHRPKWERNLKMKSWAKGSDFALVYITEPVKEKGQVFLKREGEMWNWLPSISRTIKIPPSMMMQSWMGSDMTNDDMVNESSIVNDYDHKILGEEVLEGYSCYKIEMIPHEDAPVVWGKIITWISTEKFFSLRNEYYDEDDYLVNVETLTNIKDVGDRTIPTKFTITPIEKKDHYTVMEFENIRFNDPIEDGFFSQQNMKRVR
jgi:outer membrane lipoprotein-sorting protein